jgi:3-oxoacyl-[acyl-carrier protein] reductase
VSEVGEAVARPPRVAAEDMPVVMVTGGSRGLGMALVRRFLDHGWRVATCSRSRSEFVEAVSVDHAESFLWEGIDVTDARVVRDFVTACVRHFGRIDVLVNNVGSLHTELLLTTAADRVAPLLETNLLAPILFTQACARVMVRQRRGSIINIASVSAMRGYRGVSVYAAAKAGLEGFSRSAARELGSFNIRVNSVVPGFFDSGMTSVVGDMNRDKIQRRTPLGRLGTAEEMADAVMFLASPQSGFVSGHSLVVDGGITC